MAKDNEKDRYKRIKNKKDENNLIAENGLKGNVVDVYDILERTTDSPTIIKLKKLRQFGVTDEMIVNAYEGLAGKVENTNTAIKKLGIVYRNLAIQISKEPNGIVINLATGDIDVRKSLAEARRLGLDVSSHREKIERKEEFNLFKEKDNEKKETLEIMAINYFKEHKYNKYMTDSVSSFSQVMNDKEMQSFIKKDVNLLKLSDVLKNGLKNARKEITNADRKEMVLIKLERELDAARGTAKYTAILKQRDEFIRDNPKLEPIAQNLRDENGVLSKDAIIRHESYTINLRLDYVLTGLARFNEKDLNSLSPEERTTLIKTVLGGLDFTQKNKNLIAAGMDPTVSFELVDSACKFCWEMLDRLDPELGRIRREEKSQGYKDELYAFLEKELGLEQKLDQKSFTSLIKDTTTALDFALDYLQDDKRNIRYQKVERFILGKSAKKIADSVFNKFFNKNAEILDLDVNALMQEGIKSDFKKYTEKSQIDFIKRDEARFDRIYRECTVNSWIEDKQDAVMLSYASMHYMKDKYGKMEPKTKYAEERLAEITKRLEEFEKTHDTAGYKYSNGVLTGEVRNKFERYRRNMSDAGMLKYYSVDMVDFANGKTYEELSDAHKKAYIRNTLVGLSYEDTVGLKEKGKAIEKMAIVRLEMMNSDKKKFVTFDQEGNPIVNKELILEEYQKMSEYKYSSFEELQLFAESRKDEYVYSKLEEYEKLDPEYFMKLNRKVKPREIVHQIEDIRAASHQREAQQTSREVSENRREESTTEENSVKKEEYNFDFVELAVDPKAKEIIDRIEEQSSSETVHKEEFNNESLTEEVQTENNNQELNDNSSIANKKEEQIKNDKKQNVFVEQMKFAIAKIRNAFTPRLTDGKNEEKKEGFLNKLFGKKSDTVEEKSETNTVESKGTKKNAQNSFEQYYHGPVYAQTTKNEGGQEQSSKVTEGNEIDDTDVQEL